MIWKSRRIAHSSDAAPQHTCRGGSKNLSPMAQADNISQNPLHCKHMSMQMHAKDASLNNLTNPTDALSGILEIKCWLHRLPERTSRPQLQLQRKMASIP
jgi:hypothetical protein